MSERERFDRAVDEVIEELDTYARGYDLHEYGLPRFGDHLGDMRKIVRDAIARSGQAASGYQENARSDVQKGVGGGQPEAPTAAPLADEQATAFLLELRAVVAETMKRPGEAVPIPARVRTEVAKFMRDQPSVFDRLPYGEVVALAEFCGGVVAHPPARSGAGSEDAHD